ncbi:MAG: glycoside hydrolase family 127 protein [Acidobacteriaceae bacterium]|nr:glycoside hydrolase family 127 protein [Acidobacteriaceae bacterium]
MILPLLVVNGRLAAQVSKAAKGVVPNRAPLQANAYNPLPLGSIEPRGWLRNQLEIQAAGLTGHLGEFWSDVGPNSGWLGGTGEAWERGPYYLDGLLPLAYELNDPALIRKAKQWVDWTLTHQQADGEIGPASNDDWWPRMVMLKVLTQYEEVTGDARVIPVMQKYFAYELRELPNRPLRDWGKYRWQDNVYSVLWLYNRTGDNSLLGLAKLLHSQGYDWEAQFANFKYTSKETREKLGLEPHQLPSEAAMQTHGVNNAMALKVAPVWWLVSGELPDRSGLAHQLAMLDKYHGLPNGMFSGDEHFAGRDPSQGIELCAVVETMFSLEQAFAILGDSHLADRLEKVTFNALPGTLSNDMWSHQYDQQPNQIACTRAPRPWSTNGPDSNLFGLEPNFGCCTANLHQGWPKFVSALWMATPGGGLVATAYAPNEVHTRLNGQDISIEEETQYPFRGEVWLTVHASGRSGFALLLRVPAWASSASVQVNQTPPSVVKQANIRNGFYSLRRDWKDGDTVLVSFPMRPRTSHWYHDSIVFESGPVVFSLPLNGKWSELKSYAEKSADWQITPTAPWNFGVEVGECDATIREEPVGAVPFDVQHPAVSMEIKGRRLPQWKDEDNSAGPLPLSPVMSKEPLQSLRLIPYGSAKLRVTAFPFLSDPSRCGANKEVAVSSDR